MLCITKSGIVVIVGTTERGKKMYGLNDKNSPNFVADQRERILISRLLMEQSQDFNVSIKELLEEINK